MDPHTKSNSQTQTLRFDCEQIVEVPVEVVIKRTKYIVLEESSDIPRRKNLREPPHTKPNSQNQTLPIKVDCEQMAEVPVEVVIERTVFGGLRRCGF